MKTLLLSLSLLVLTHTAEAKKNPPANPMVKQISALRFEVSRSALEREVRDPMAQLSTFTALPGSGSGLFSGIAVSGFKKGCLLPRFGIQDGDVVELVNGQTLSSPSDILEVGQKLAKAREGAKVRVNLRRGEQDLVQTYLLVK